MQLLLEKGASKSSNNGGSSVPTKPEPEPVAQVSVSGFVKSSIGNTVVGHENNTGAQLGSCLQILLSKSWLKFSSARSVTNIIH